jgi:hypothetical protein
MTEKQSRRRGGKIGVDSSNPRKFALALSPLPRRLSQRPMTDALQDPDRLAEYFAFLDAVREGGSINMFAGSVPLRKIYGLDDATAKRVLVAWTKTVGTLRGCATSVGMLLRPGGHDVLAPRRGVHRDGRKPSRSALISMAVSVD